MFDGIGDAAGDAFDAVSDVYDKGLGILDGITSELESLSDGSGRRIDQKGEMLYTVRPRYMGITSKKRSTKSSIRFYLPEGDRKSVV